MTRPWVATNRSWWLVVMAAASLMAGCVRPVVLYDWGQYESSLQAGYVTHDETAATAALAATVTGQRNGRVPPGACAEYGFLLYKRGQSEQAIQYLQQEATLFPESKPLMDKLVAKIQQRDAEAARAADDGGEQ